MCTRGGIRETRFPTIGVRKIIRRLFWVVYDVITRLRTSPLYGPGLTPVKILNEHHVSAIFEQIYKISPYMTLPCHQIQNAALWKVVANYGASSGASRPSASLATQISLTCSLCFRAYKLIGAIENFQTPIHYNV